MIAVPHTGGGDQYAQQRLAAGQGELNLGPQARPIYHHKRDSIEAHLSILFAARAISRFIEQTPGWSIRKFVRTARRYRTVQIQADARTLTAADPLPDDLRHALDRIHHSQDAH